MDIKLRYKILASGLLLAGVFLWSRCSRKVIPSSGPVVLPIDVKERVSVRRGVVTIETHQGIHHISGVREGVLTIKNDGTTQLSVKDFGWEHRLGFNGYIGVDGGALGLDMRPYYYKRIDAMIGMGYFPKTQLLDLWLGVGYTPVTTWTSNTTLFIGYSVHKNPVAGLSLQF